MRVLIADDSVLLPDAATHRRVKAVLTLLST